MLGGVNELALLEPLVGGRCVLRRFVTEDVGPFGAFLEDEEATQFLPFPPEFRSTDGAWRLISETIGRYDTSHPLLAYAAAEPDSGGFIGFCGMTPRGDDELELMYGVVRGRWGEGIGTEIAAALCAHVRRVRPKGRCVGFVHPDNRRSLAVLEGLGFRSEGLERHDMFEEPVLKLAKAC